MQRDEYGWLRSAIARFGASCKQKLSGGGSPEASIRGPLEVLLQTVGEHHKQHEVTWHDEYALRDLGVRPDYAVRTGQDIIGYIELKRPGLSVDPETFGKSNRERARPWRLASQVNPASPVQNWLCSGSRHGAAPQTPVVTDATPRPAFPRSGFCRVRTSSGFHSVCWSTWVVSAKGTTPFRPAK